MLNSVIQGNGVGFIKPGKIASHRRNVSVLVNYEFVSPTFCIFHVLWYIYTHINMLKHTSRKAARSVDVAVGSSVIKHIDFRLPRIFNLHFEQLLFFFYYRKQAAELCSCASFAVGAWESAHTKVISTISSASFARVYFHQRKGPCGVFDENSFRFRYSSRFDSDIPREIIMNEITVKFRNSYVEDWRRDRVNRVQSVFCSVSLWDIEMFHESFIF